MDIHDDRDLFPGAPEDQTHALGVITAIVLVAGFAMVAAWFALLVMDDRRSAPPVARADTSACRICGVVERVSELAPAPLQQLEGSRAEGAVILLAALGGASPGGHQLKIYETSVLQDDGSVRVLRDVGAPLWKPGDRVKVLRGRVEPDASPAGKKPIPARQAAQGR